MVAQNTKAPNGPEFQRFNQQLKLGDSLESVMNGFRQRVPSKDVAIFVSTILIQQRVGGNLSAVLSNMSETLEERNRIHKEISTVTAESRSIAYILVDHAIFNGTHDELIHKRIFECSIYTVRTHLVRRLYCNCIVRVPTH